MIVTCIYIRIVYDILVDSHALNVGIVGHNMHCNAFNARRWNTNDRLAKCVASWFARNTCGTPTEYLRKLPTTPAYSFRFKSATRSLRHHPRRPFRGKHEHHTWFVRLACHQQSTTSKRYQRASVLQTSKFAGKSRQRF